MKATRSKYLQSKNIAALLSAKYSKMKFQNNFSNCLKFQTIFQGQISTMQLHEELLGKSYFS